MYSHTFDNFRIQSYHQYIIVMYFWREQIVAVPPGDYVAAWKPQSAAYYNVRCPNKTFLFSNGNAAVWTTDGRDATRYCTVFDNRLVV